MKKKICYVTTVAGTLKNFIVPAAKYISENTDWEIYMISNDDAEFAASLPSNFHFIPVKMERGISLGGIKAMRQIKKIFDPNNIGGCHAGIDWGETLVS